MIIDFHHDRAFVERFHSITLQYQGRIWVFEACHNIRKNSSGNGTLLIYWPENIYSRWSPPDNEDNSVLVEMNTVCGLSPDDEAELEFSIEDNFLNGKRDFTLNIGNHSFYVTIQYLNEFYCLPFAVISGGDRYFGMVVVVKDIEYPDMTFHYYYWRDETMSQGLRQSIENEINRYIPDIYRFFGMEFDPGDTVGKVFLHTPAIWH